MNNFQVGQTVYVPAVVTREADSDGEVGVHLLSDQRATPRFIPATLLVAGPPPANVLHVLHIDGLTAAIRAHRDKTS